MAIANHTMEVFLLKAGAGCYWDPRLNGGTVLRITENGVTEVWHEFVDPTNYRE